MNARALTQGADILFGADEYSPGSATGRRLLAHELTHVVQQGAAARHRPQPFNGSAHVVKQTAEGDWIQGAWFKIGKQRIDVNYDDVILTPVGDFVSKVESLYMSWTGAANANAIHAKLAALPARQQQWVMLGLDLLKDNTERPAHDSLNRKVAVQRLIERAPNTSTSLASPLPEMEKEVLQVSGWLEVALAAPLKAPTGQDMKDVKAAFFPPTSAGSTHTSVSHLDKAKLKSRLTPALKHFIKKIDPRASPSVGTRSLPTLKKLGDKVLDEAKTFFSPYSHSARSSVFSPVHASFKISKNIHSTTSGIDRDLRVSYLDNRGQIVGNRRKPPNALFIDKDIFFDAAYNHSVASDRAELEKIAQDVEKEATIRPIVNALIAFTGRQSGRVEQAEIWLPLTYRKSRYPTECKARWRVIKTLSHEVLHALSHPNFSKQKVGLGQIISEGFTEALGVQLYNDHIVPKSKKEAGFKSTLEQGLGSAPCGDPPKAEIGYKPAGPAAESIREKVKDKNFRAAYFLGAVDKVGL
ncbi:MAG: DUF4157 domain-containing protein, partial [Gammaproteobacteria bacterium]|nr:DUF4157 domain-containing protein [Gammaproteobacteria bacterium]